MYESFVDLSPRQREILKVIVKKLKVKVTHLLLGK